MPDRHLSNRQEGLIASPLPLLIAEEGRQASEALFCTFNADLEYFEQTVLGVAQSAGAQVTVIADGQISDPDPRAVRNAGTRYVHGLAVTASGAAFHPKLTVIAGPERAVIAIGSGNLSPAGWHLNKETWTVVTAGRERCPAIVADVAGWLRTLDQVCAITPAAVRGAGRVAVLLEQLAAAAPPADTGHRLVHTSQVAIIDQLPSGAVGHLRLYAPFHDEKAVALRRLVERLRPGRVTLAVQSGARTVIQPDAVRQVITDLGVPFDVLEDAEENYRHGKLIEATGTDGSRWTLTGSPNLSARALLLSARDGGNIEMGVVSRPGTSLFPAGRPISLDDVPAVRVTGSSVRRTGAHVTLLAVARRESGLEVAFSGALTDAVSLLAADAATPDRWTRAGTVPAGAANRVLVGVDLPAGTPVRCAWSTAPDPGGTDPGGVVFVTDPSLVLVRSVLTRPADPATLIGDPPLLERWLHALSELAGARQGATRPPAEEDWPAYAEDAEAQLGTGMFNFVLGGFPRLNLLAQGPGESLAPADLLLEDNRAGLDTDDAATVGDDTDPGAAAASADAAHGDTGSGRTSDHNLTDSARRRIRRDLEATVQSALPSLPAFHRVAILSLVLYAVQAKVWDTPLGDHGWFPVVGKVLEKIDQNDIPDRLSASASSWVATAVYLMHEHRPTAGRPAEIVLYEKAADSVSHLFADADPQVIADIATPFTNKNGYPVDLDAVMDLISMVVQDDPLAEAIDILEANHPAWDVHKHNDRLLHVRGEFRGTFLPAAEALDAMPANGTTAVWATGITSGWTMAIRDEDSLIRVERDPKGQVTWWHYRTGSLTRPTTIARDPEVGNRARIRHGALNQPFPEAIQAMVAVGANPTVDPPLECTAD